MLFVPKTPEIVGVHDWDSYFETDELIEALKLEKEWEQFKDEDDAIEKLLDSIPNRLFKFEEIGDSTIKVTEYETD